MGALPERSALEIDSRCNLRCSMCAVSRSLAGRPQRSLDPAALDAVEGDVAPCQIAALHPEYRFGNLAEQRFNAIYAGPGHRAFRDAVARGDRPEPCRSCSCVFEAAGSGCA